MLMRVGIRKNVAGMAHVYDKLVKAVVRSLVNLQGGATQSDSMDRIKRAIGEMAAKMLAKVMSPQSCARIAPVYTEAEAKAWVQMYAWDSEELLANNAGALLTVIKQRQAKMLSEKVAEVVSLREAYQISFEKMFYSAELQKEYNVSAKGMDIIILTLMVHALAAVGHDAKVNVDAMELVFGNLNKVSKIGDVTELMSRPEVVVNQSIQAYLLNAAVAIKP
jgi:hypothetical protein